MFFDCNRHFYTDIFVSLLRFFHISLFLHFHNMDILLLLLPFWTPHFFYFIISPFAINFNPFATSPKLLKELGDKETDVTICNALALEMDEMWSFYHDKKHQIWLWWAVEHSTNTPVAFTFGTREHQYLDELLKLLKPFNIKTVYTDNNFAYQNKISPDILIPGKKNTQKIERNHLTLRTRIKRLARKSICFSKNKDIHQTVIASFINIFFWRRKLPDFN